MSRVDLIINGKNARTTWGVVPTGQTLSALLAPPPMKPRTSFSSRLENGTRIDNSNPRVAERSVNLEIQMLADSPEQFYSRHEDFCNELAKGEIKLYTSDRPETVYRMLYDSCTAYTQFIREYATLSLKLTEPNPKDRNNG